MHDTGSSQCGSPVVPSMEGLTSGCLSFSRIWNSSLVSLARSPTICPKSSLLKYFFSDHSLSSVSMGSVPGAFAAARTDFTSAGKYGNDADATNDLVSEYVLVAWYRTSFMIYNMDSRSLNNGRVAEYADKNRMAPFNQYGFWESCTYRDLLSGRAVFENPFSCFLFALARTWYNTYLHFAL